MDMLRRRGARRLAAIGSLLVVFAALSARAADDAPPSDAALRKIVADYVGLYRADALDQWKDLFHPGLTVADPRPDGSIRVRGLQEFYQGQKGAFAAGRATG